MYYGFDLLHHVGVVAKRLCAVAAEHERDDNTPGRGVIKTGSHHAWSPGIIRTKKFPGEV